MHLLDIMAFFGSLTEMEANWYSLNLIITMKLLLTPLEKNHQIFHPWLYLTTCIKSFHLEMAIEKLLLLGKTTPHIAHVPLFIYSFIYFYLLFFILTRQSFIFTNSL